MDSYSFSLREKLEEKRKRKSGDCPQNTCAFEGEKCLCKPLEGHFPPNLLKDARKISLEEGAALSPDDFSEPVVLAVLEGIVAIESHLSDGRRSLLALRFPGEFLDLFRADRKSSGSVIALSKSTIKFLPKKIFEELLMLEDNIRSNYYQSLTDTLHQQFDHSSDLGKKTPAERMASFIFELRNRLHIPAEDEHFDLPLSRQNIADYLGLRAETLSRVLKTLVDSEAISFPERNTVRINDFRALRRIANGARPRKGGGD